MDKRKVIKAYRRGLLTVEECAQILGADSIQIMGMVNEQPHDDPPEMIQETVNR